jgi:hypothetical protein
LYKVKSKEGRSVRLVVVEVIAIRGEKKAGALIDRGTVFVDWGEAWKD